MIKFNDNNGQEPSEVQKWRLRLWIRYLIVIFAIFHSLFVIQLAINHQTPTLQADDGYEYMCLLYLMVNIFLYDCSCVFKFCIWHRFPILFNIYYDVTRLFWAKRILHWSADQWNYYDILVLKWSFSLWIIGYCFHRYVKPYIIYYYEKYKTAHGSTDAD